MANVNTGTAVLVVNQDAQLSLLQLLVRMGDVEL